MNKLEQKETTKKTVQDPFVARDVTCRFMFVFWLSDL